MNLKWLYCTVLGLVFISSCGKDPLTKPTNVSFQLVLTNNDKFFATADSGSIFISNIEFAGVRSIGTGIYFSSGLDSSLWLPIESGKYVKISDYDLPVGVYDRIVTKLSLLYDSNGHRNKNPRLKVVGRYKNLKGDMVPFVFSLTIEKIIELDALDVNGGKVELSLDKTSKANFILHSEKLFAGILQKTLDAGSFTEINDRATLVISESSNVEIFNKMVSNIDNTFELLFNTTI